MDVHERRQVDVGWNKTNDVKIMKNCLIGMPTDNLLQPMANFTIINIVNN